MKRAEKKELVEALHEKLSKAKSLVLTDYRGLDTSAMNRLRRQLREASVEYRVVKNTLMSRAADGTDTALLKDYFAGPSAAAISYDDPVSPAKVLVKFAEEHAALEVKAGVIDGRVVDMEGIKQLSRLPSHEALLGQLLSVFSGPARSLVTVLSGVPRSFLGVLNAIKEQKTSP
ncbi:MAG: 50S ribosomal protein L10 [Deltaproteobacteria bacterium]|nr:50S ribosomal protein L10 [Deltaproteobacteria bacterium]